MILELKKVAWMKNIRYGGEQYLNFVLALRVGNSTRTENDLLLNSEKNAIHSSISKGKKIVFHARGQYLNFVPGHPVCMDFFPQNWYWRDNLFLYSKTKQKRKQTPATQMVSKSNVLISIMQLFPIEDSL